MVEKFFHTTDSAVLFPEFVSRVVRQGMESDILPEITATTTNFDGMDYRTIASVPTDDDKALRRVEEGVVHSDDRHPHAGESGEAPQARTYARGELRGHPLPATGPVFRDSAPDRRVHRPYAS